MTETNIEQRRAVPMDFTAALAALQDQLDDLTAVVEDQQRRLQQLEAAAAKA